MKQQISIDAMKLFFIPNCNQLYAPEDVIIINHKKVSTKKKKRAFYFKIHNYSDGRKIGSTPRTQLFAHLPMTIEPTNEHERLDQRLLRYKMVRKVSIGDGNCVVRSIADQIHGDEERHPEVRRAGVARLIGHRDLYEVDYRPPDLTPYQTYDEYIRMSSCNYQDVFPLLTQAICDAYRIRIIELVSDPNYCFAEFIPSDGRVFKSIRLVSSLIHTDSMYPR